MVNNADSIRKITTEFKKSFGNSIVFLIACGSLGRGDLKEGWSDIDLFLVLKVVNTEVLKKISKLEKILNKIVNTETDIAVVSKKEFYEADYGKLPDKFKNYIFFIDQEKILIGQKEKFRQMSVEEYLNTIPPFVLDYHRRLKRLIIDNINNADQRRLLIKSIKFLFLLLRKIAADTNFQPNTYIEAIAHAKRRKLPLNYMRLNNLMEVRYDITINRLSKKQISDNIKLAYDAVIQLTNYYIR